MRPLTALVVILCGALAGVAAKADVLAEYKVEAGAIPEPLTDEPGVPARGKRVVIDPERGNCMICHPMPIAEVEFQGDVGPDLAGIGSRYSEDELRLRVVDPKRLIPESVMPAYHRTEGLHRVLEQYRGEPILTPQEVEDVVAYLRTLESER